MHGEGYRGTRGILDPPQDVEPLGQSVKRTRVGEQEIGAEVVAQKVGNCTPGDCVARFATLAAMPGTLTG